MKTYFVDGIGKIAINRGVCQIELSLWKELDQANDPGSLIGSERLAMPVEVLLQLHAAVSNVVDQLEDKGLVKKNG